MNQAAKMMKNEPVSSKAKTVFLYLAYHSDNQTNDCTLTLATLADDCGFSVSTVQRALQELLMGGYIRKTHRYKDGMQAANLYEVIGEIVDRIKVAADNAWQQYHYWRRRMATIEENKKQRQLSMKETEEPHKPLKLLRFLFSRLVRLPIRT